MDDYLLPTNVVFVEELAKEIARNRFHQDALNALADVGLLLSIPDEMEKAIDNMLEGLWNSDRPSDVAIKQTYIKDASAAINFINLKLMTS